MDYFDILLAKKLSGGGGGGEITVEGLTVNDNGTYTAPSGKAYSPVVVNLPLGEKAITANGEYNASADDLKGYSKVTVAVEGFKVKDMPTGAISSFDDGTENPLKELKVSIVPVQSGSGDPSPSNPRPISGWTEAEIHVADGENPHVIDNVTNIPLGQEVFGGELDVTTGVLQINKIGYKLDELDWTLYNNNYFRTPVIDELIAGVNNVVTTAMCSIYKSTAPNNIVDKSINVATNKRIVIKDDDCSTKETFIASLSGIYAYCDIENQIVITLTPTQVSSILGVNNIWADCGDVISGKYFASL